MIELRPGVSREVCEKTHLLAFLLARVRVKRFDTNKLYASELLSILLQASGSDCVTVLCDCVTVCVCV